MTPHDAVTCCVGISGCYTKTTRLMSAHSDAVFSVTSCAVRGLRRWVKFWRVLQWCITEGLGFWCAYSTLKPRNISQGVVKGIRWNCHFWEQVVFKVCVSCSTKSLCPAPFFFFFFCQWSVEGELRSLWWYSSRHFWIRVNSFAWCHWCSVVPVMLLF